MSAKDKEQEDKASGFPDWFYFVLLNFKWKFLTYLKILKFFPPRMLAGNLIWKWVCFLIYLYKFTYNK